MRIDIHTHLFPPPVTNDRNRYLDDPAFGTLYTDPAARLATADDLLRQMDTDGISLSVIVGFPWEEPDRLRRHNDSLLEAATCHPDRLIPFCCVHPEHPDAAREAERCLMAGARGIGEIACYGRDFDADLLDHLDPVMQVAKKWDVPVMLHTNEPVGHRYPGKAPMTLKGITDLASRFPENRILCAHGGGGLPFYGLLKKSPLAAGNLWFDTAAFPYLYQSASYRHLMEILPPDRLVFGSDWPLLPPRRYFQDMEAAGLSPDQIRSLTEKAASTLLRL